MDISELKAKLRSLKGKKEITFDFVKDAYVVRIERPCDAQERQEIVAELCAEVNRLEKIRVQKVDDTYAAFLPVAFSTFSEALPKHPESDDEQEGKIDNADAPLKRSIASYFSSELAADQDPGQPRKVSRWGFVDPILVEKQKKEWVLPVCTQVTPPIYLFHLPTGTRICTQTSESLFGSDRVILLREGSLRGSFTDSTAQSTRLRNGSCGDGREVDNHIDEHSITVPGTKLTYGVKENTLISVNSSAWRTNPCNSTEHRKTDPRVRPATSPHELPQ